MSFVVSLKHFVEFLMRHGHMFNVPGISEMLGFLCRQIKSLFIFSILTSFFIDFRISGKKKNAWTSICPHVQADYPEPNLNYVIVPEEIMESESCFSLRYWPPKLEPRSPTSMKVSFSQRISSRSLVYSPTAQLLLLYRIS